MKAAGLNGVPGEPRYLNQADMWRTRLQLQNVGCLSYIVLLCTLRSHLRYSPLQSSPPFSRIALDLHFNDCGHPLPIPQNDPLVNYL